MVRKTIGIIGSGKVGTVLAAGFVDVGYQVMLGCRQPENLKIWNQEHPEVAISSFEDAASFGQILVVAVKGSVAADVVSNIDSSHFLGKTVIDTTNPVSAQAPTNNVLSFFTGPNESLMEALQSARPKANFVKCFSCVPSAVMVHPPSKEKPSMFICGNHGGAKIEVRNILRQFGWEVADMGALEAARAIEPLARLACIHGFATGDWNVSFKFIRGQQ